MPRATVDNTATERFPLKTLPAKGTEDEGFVELRKLSYGETLERRDMATKMAIEGIDDRNAANTSVAVDIIQKAVTEFEFKLSIVSHNLEDKNGTLLNFGDPATISMLEGPVGKEIAELIDDLNNWDSDLTGKDKATSEPESKLA